MVCSDIVCGCQNKSSLLTCCFRNRYSRSIIKTFSFSINCQSSETWKSSQLQIKVAIFEEFLKQMVTTPPQFFLNWVFFRGWDGGRREGGREAPPVRNIVRNTLGEIFGWFPVRFVTLNSGQRTELHHQTMTPQQSDVTPPYFDRKLAVFVGAFCVVIQHENSPCPLRLEDD